MPEVAQFPGWKRLLVKRKNGDPFADEGNAKIALEQCPELRGIFQYDEFRDVIQLSRPLPGMPRDDLDALFQDDSPTPFADEHLTELIVWLGDQGLRGLRRNIVQDVVIAVAKRNAVHPVRSYLLECRDAWDGVPRLDTWLATYFRSPDDAEYLRAVGSRFLIGAVARIIEPGCQMDSILVLEGEQGAGKSTAVRILGRHRWTFDVTGDLGNKDAAIGLQRCWIAEMAELASLRRSEQESIKGFISRRIDHYRPPYGRNSVERPRHTVFIATTNETEYLQDSTGGRRYWPLMVGQIDIEALERDVDQLWGEAVTRYQAKERWHLEGVERVQANKQQTARLRVSPVDLDILRYADSLRKSGVTRIEMKQLLRDVFDIDTRQDPHQAGALAKQAAAALTAGGWKRLRVSWGGGERVLAFEYAPEAPQAPQAENDIGMTQAPQAPQAESAEDDSDIPF